MAVRTLLIKTIIYLWTRYLFGRIIPLYRLNEGRNGWTSSDAKETNGRQHVHQSSVVCSKHFTEDCFEYATITVEKYKTPKLKKDSYGVCVFPTLDTNSTSESVESERTKRVKRREVSCCITRNAPKCTLCKQPMKGHKNVTNCPRNQKEWQYLKTYRIVFSYVVICINQSFQKTPIPSPHRK